MTVQPSPRSPKFIGLLLLVLLVGLWLYWPAVRLPLIYDTLLHIRISKGLDWRTVWLPTEAFGFYRPLTFVPLLVVKGLWGEYPGRVLQLLNIGQHLLNSLLLIGLCWRLWHRWWQALVAGLLFVVFPFSYQAVAVYGHAVHPTTTGLLLLALHAYLSAMTPAGTRYWLFTTLLFLLALLSHESAILFGALAALGQWNWQGWSRLKSPRLIQDNPWLLFLLFGAIYLLIYRFLPITRAPQAGGEGVGSLGLRALYLLQAVAYPFAPFVPVLLGAGGTALWVIWQARRPETRLPLLFAWGWWGLASLLIAIPLPTDYLLHGPRLLYLGAIGLAIGWSWLVDLPNRWLSVFLVGLIVLPNVTFVGGRLADYRRLTEPVEVIAGVMAGRPAAEGITLVNLPDWLAPPTNRYPVGVEFVAMLGNYLFVEELLAENLGVDHPAQAVVLPELLSQTDYAYGLHNQSPLTELGQWPPGRRQHIFITRYLPTGPQTLYTGRIEPPTANQLPLVTFTYYHLLAANAVNCADKVQVTLTWRPEANIPPTISIFVQLITPDGQFLAGADGPPLSLRPDLLPGSGRNLVDIRHVPAGTSADQLLIGVYDYLTGQRQAAQDSQANPLPDNAFRLPLSPCP